MIKGKEGEWVISSKKITSWYDFTQKVPQYIAVNFTAPAVQLILPQSRYFLILLAPDTNYLQN